MKGIFFFFALLTLFCLPGLAQDVTVYDPPIEYVGNFGDVWGTDLIAFNTEPYGKESGVRRPTDTLYIAVPDSVGLGTGGLRILKTSNNGANWVQTITASNFGIIPKTRMLRSGLDSIYCLFRTAGNAIYILRVSFPFVDPLRQIFTGGYRDFDAWSSSTGGLYVFLDTLGTGNIPRLSSTNGGITWSQRGLVTSAGAHPFCYRSGTGDTALLAYYITTTGLTDTTTAGITVARYRESAPGTLASFGFIQPLVPAGLQKDQFSGVLFGTTAWFLYTEGAPGSRNIMFVTSTNNGANWSAASPLANRPAVDEYWFDIQHYTFSPGGVDAIYYYDSTGGPNNTSDRILYTSATITTPGTFTATTQISEHAPQPSTRGYTPFLIEFYNAAGDVGALWVGLDGSNRRLYFDRLGAPVGVNNNQNGIPEIYSLSQNYPNPFNPTTKIDFAIPKNGLVTLKVYDVLGQEVALLVNKDFQAGSYTFDYDASMLPSGVYFYKITSGDFTETKKMMLVK